jgi:O-antigen/teichoic acid export membrane protein
LSLSADDRIPVGPIIKRLARHSFVYGLADTLGRAISFLLIPLYTTRLLPAEYGIFATINALLTLMAPLAGLGLNAAAMKFHLDVTDGRPRNRFYGGIWLASAAAGGFLSLVGLTVGRPVLEAVMPKVPYAPYLEWTLLTAALITLQPVALAKLQMEQRPVSYLIYEVGYFLVYNLAIVWFAVVRHQGAWGVVKGQVLSAGIAAAAAGLLVGRGILAPSFTRLGAALAYGVPLVPHVVGGWFLAASDRFFLQRYSTLDVIGIYNVGYQFGSILDLVLAAAATAWTPIFFRINSEQPEPAARDAVARLTSLFSAAIVFLGLAFGVTAPVALHLVVGARFTGAGVFVPYLAATAVAHGLYFLVVAGIFWSARTGLLALATATAGAVNIGANVLLIPSHQGIGAALATLIAFGVLMVLAAVVSVRVFRVPYEWDRLGLLTCCAGLTLAVVWALPGAGLFILVRLGVVLAFPPLLLVVGFFRPSEVARARQALRRWARPSS